MNAMLVIGAGKFGSNLALTLTSLGNEVLVVDADEEQIDKIAQSVARAQIGDCMDPDVLKEIGVRNFDICFVCVSDNFQASMEITSLLKENGAAYVVSKADSEIHERLLLKLGANEVVYPERDLATKTAVRYSTNGAFDYIELSPEYAITEIEPPQSWVGSSIGEMNIRALFQVNVIGARIGSNVQAIVDTNYVFKKNEHIYIAGEQKDVIRLIKV